MEAAATTERRPDGQRTIQPRTTHDHPLRLIFGEIKKDAREGGLTDAEIDAELSRHRAARRH
jgi:hypothetical protein